MKGSSVVYQVADSSDLTEEIEAGLSTSAGLSDIHDALHASEPMESPPSPSKRRWIYIVAAVSLLTIAGAVTGALVRHTANSDNDKPAMNTPKSEANSSSSTSSSGLPPVPAGRPEVYYVKVVHAYPHDTKAFLQGFEYSSSQDVFYESTGLTGGRSSLRRVNVTTGAVLKKVGLPSNALFGEGLTLHTDKHIYMLTWKAGRGFVFNQNTFEIEREWKYPGEGWGLAYDESKDIVYMSDGTDSIRLLDPETLSEKRRIKVTYDGEAVRDLNELEVVCGELWANVWQTEYIYRIDPSTGKVRSVISVPDLPLKKDLTGDSIDVLNGIAFDKKTRRLWISGKLWPKVYEVVISDETFDKQCGK